ncbi:MAG: hypothetical protein IJK04_09280, partial [Kiritimatiellae bacterium]|nr:hypothetical protein [Kiritimatiellia bacterium]
MILTMAPNTTKLGISVFDQAFGGIYLHKPTILCGRRKSGKFVVASQLIVKTLLVGDKIVLFTQKTPEEAMRMMPADSFDVGEAVENRQLIICPYAAMAREGTGPYAPLPFPQALDELAKLVSDNGITYAVFDSIVPWTAIHPLEAMQEHVDTFFSTLDGLGLTSLLLLPEPASAAALSLSTTLRELCPINLEIASKNFGAEFTMQVTKYQGMTGAAKKLPMKFALDLTPGVGFDSPDAHKPRTMGDLEALETFSHSALAHKQKAGPAFRPFQAGGPATFCAPTHAAPTTAAPTPAAPAPAAPTPPVKAAPAKQETSGAKPEREIQRPSFAPFLSQPGLASFDTGQSSPLANSAATAASAP